MPQPSDYPYTHFKGLPMDTLLKATCDILPPTGYSLNNEVHPILAQINFPLLSDDEYEAIIPAIRLISHILGTDSLLRYWHVLLRGEERKVKNAGGEGHHAAYFPRRPKLTSRDIRLAKLDLLNLAKCVAFTPKDLGGHSGGIACADPDVKLSQQIFDASGKLESFFSGNPVQVFYEKSLHDGICSLYRKAEGQSQRFGVKLLTQYFVLAKLLLHELAHAADMARYGAKYGEDEDIPFEYSIVAEAGFECEYSLFGGIPHWYPGMMMTIEDWPSPSIRAFYLTNGLHMWFGGELEEVYTRRWRIPDLWIAQLFQKEYWQRVVPRLGAKAVIPPKLLGYRFKEADCTCDICKKAPEVERNLLRPDVPGCVSGHIDPVNPPRKDQVAAREVPKGYIVWKDGTLVLEKLSGTVRKIEATMSR